MKHEALLCKCKVALTSLLLLSWTEASLDSHGAHIIAFVFCSNELKSSHKHHTVRLSALTCGVSAD